MLFCPPISTPSPPKRCGRIYLFMRVCECSLFFCTHCTCSLFFYAQEYWSDNFAWSHVCVCIYVRTQDYACTHTNTYTYMQIQQVRAHACVHCKTLQNFAMHNKYHHGGIMLYTLRRIALHSCIHTSIHTYIYTLHCLYYIKQYYTVHRTEHYNTCQYNTLQPTT